VTDLSDSPEAQLQALEAYFRLMNFNGASHVFRVASEAGILAALERGGGDAQAIAEASGARERPTRLVLEALRAMGLVTQNDEARYRLTPVAEFILSGPYKHLGDEYWAHLPTFLKSDAPLKKMDDAAQSETHYQLQAYALAWMLAPACELAAERLDIGGNRRGLSILDVGAGAAGWSLAMAKRDPAARVMANDWPAVLEIAQMLAMQQGLDDRLTLLPGNYHEVEFPPAAFDLAILGNVTHLETPEGNAALFRRVRAALKPAGELVIFDAFPGRPEGELNLALYDLGLAMRTQHGKVYTLAELTALLANAGFEQPELTPLPVPPYAVGMLVARAKSA
jgi:ubiquinone/menaquinone biosynthesis C-methylase UbiE